VDWGTAQELANAEEAIFMAVTRSGNRFRKDYLIDRDVDGELILKKKHADLSRRWLVSADGKPKRPGQLLKFLDESFNREDEFVQKFVVNPDLCKDPIFMESLNRIKVSFISY
jgi:hypothetical protein